MIAAAYQDDDLVAALSWASSAVEAYCERHFTQVVGDVVRINPFSDSTALLPDPPVTNVTLVEGWLAMDGSMTWTTLTNYDFTPDGRIWDTTRYLGVPWSGPSWPCLPRSLRVTYDHGFVTTPQPVIDAVIKAAAGYLSNPFNMTEHHVGGVTDRWSDKDRTPVLDDALLGSYRLLSV